MATQAATLVNGLNIDQLTATIKAIEQNPELARFEFRAHNEWAEGGHSRTSIQGFYGAGREDTSRSHSFILEGDEPPLLLGGNAGPNAVEAVLHAPASCLAVGFVYNAAAEGITIETLRFDLEGELNLHAFLGLSEQGRAGLENIKLTCLLKSDAPREKLEALCRYVTQTSPVLDIITNPVPVTVTLHI